LAIIATNGIEGEEAQGILGVLRDAGLPVRTAHKVLRAITAIADTVQKTWGGKLQRWLRKTGEAMIKDLSARFEATGLDEAERMFAIIYWLQNVLNLPVPLRDKHVRKFEAQTGLTVDDIVAAADHLDLSVAVVDDLIFLDQKMRKTSTARKET
jgi:hypothetical protein